MPAGPRPGQSARRGLVTCPFAAVSPIFFGGESPRRAGAAGSGGLHFGRHSTRRNLVARDGDAHASWQKFRSSERYRAALRRITDAAKAVRRGDQAKRPEPSVAGEMQRAWTLMNRYLE